MGHAFVMTAVWASRLCSVVVGVAVWHGLACCRRIRFPAWSMLHILFFLHAFDIAVVYNALPSWAFFFNLLPSCTLACLFLPSPAASTFSSRFANTNGRLALTALVSFPLAVARLQTILIMLQPRDTAYEELKAPPPFAARQAG